jgi:hypothetical protein
MQRAGHSPGNALRLLDFDPGRPLREGIPVGGPSALEPGIYNVNDFVRHRGDVLNHRGVVRPRAAHVSRRPSPRKVVDRVSFESSRGPHTGTRVGAASWSGEPPFGSVAITIALRCRVRSPGLWREVRPRRNCVNGTITFRGSSLAVARHARHPASTLRVPADTIGLHRSSSACAVAGTLQRRRADSSIRGNIRPVGATASSRSLAPTLRDDPPQARPAHSREPPPHVGDKNAARIAWVTHRLSRSPEPSPLSPLAAVSLTRCPLARGPQYPQSAGYWSPLM